jgi:hypothetical protein
MKMTDSVIQRRVVSWEQTDVSEVFTASVIRATTASIILLMMEAVRTSETSVYFDESLSLLVFNR